MDRGLSGFTQGSSQHPTGIEIVVSGIGSLWISMGFSMELYPDRGRGLSIRDLCGLEQGAIWLYVSLSTVMAWGHTHTPSFPFQAITVSF